MREKEPIPAQENQDQISALPHKVEKDLKTETDWYCHLLRQMTKEAMRDKKFASTLLTEGTPLRDWLDSWPDVHFSDDDKILYNWLENQPYVYWESPAEKDLRKKIAVARVRASLPAVLEGMILDPADFAFKSTTFAETKGEPTAKAAVSTLEERQGLDRELIDAIKNGNITVLEASLKKFGWEFMRNFNSQTDIERARWIQNLRRGGFTYPDDLEKIKALEESGSDKPPSLGQEKTTWNVHREADYQDSQHLQYWLGHLQDDLHWLGSKFTGKEETWTEILEEGTKEKMTT